VDFKSFFISFAGSVPPPIVINPVDRMRATMTASANHARTILDLCLQALSTAGTKEELLKSGHTYARELTSALPFLAMPEPSYPMVPPSPTKKRKDGPAPTDQRQPKRSSADQQANGRAAGKIKSLVKKVLFVDRHQTVAKHQQKVKSYKKEIAKANHTPCHFYATEEGCRIHKCPFKHTPTLVAGRCDIPGTLTKWIQRDAKGKSFGFIDLDDGNSVFCPERAFLGAKVPKVPCHVRVTSLKLPAADTERFVADQAHQAPVEVD
jgi:hypothetical protein